MDAQSTYAWKRFISPNVCVLSLRGEIDILEHAPLAEAFDTVLSQQSRSVIVDLINVTYADSTCLHALIRAIKRARQIGKNLDLVVAKDSFFQRIFNVTGLGREFNIYYSLDQAMDAATMLASATSKRTHKKLFPKPKAS